MILHQENKITRIHYRCVLKRNHKNKTELARIVWAALFCFLKALINFIIS